MSEVYLHQFVLSSYCFFPPWIVNIELNNYSARANMVKFILHKFILYEKYPLHKFILYEKYSYKITETRKNDPQKHLHSVCVTMFYYL